MNVLVRFRWAALAIVVIVLALLAPGLQTSMDPDHGLAVWFLDDDPNLKAYGEFKESFGNDEAVVLRIEEPGGVYEEEAVERMDSVSGALRELDGVEEVHSWESIPGQLVDENEESYLLVLQMVESDDFDQRRGQILADIEETSAQYLEGQTFQKGGIGVIYQALSDLTERDFGIFVGLGYLIMFLLLWWIFRSVRLVVASLLVVAGGTVISLGLMGWLGIQINMITVLLPTLIVVLGIADAMHFPVAYRRVRREDEEATDKEVLVRALKEAAVPCLMTTVTTMAGFLALASSSLTGVRHLGLFAAIGVLAAFLISVVVMAIALYGRGADEVRELPNVRVFLDVLRRWVEERPRLVALVLAAVVVVSSIGASQVRVDTFTLGFLPADHQVVMDHETIEGQWGPYIPLVMSVEPVGDRSVESEEVLSLIASFAAKAQADEHIGGALHLETLHRLSEFGEVPEFMWEGMVDRDRNIGRINLTIEMMTASGLTETIERLEALAKEEFGEVAHVQANGYLPLYASVIYHIVDSQIRSLAIAIFLILFLMTLWLRSIRLAIISLIPNLFPVLVMLGVMGFFGIYVDAVTAVVAAIVIGVAIDDTVHFLHSWRGAEREGKSWSGCVERAFHEVGPAICITTLLLVTGYSVLLLADLVTVVYFGLLTIVAALAALVGELLLLPLLLKIWPAKKQGEFPS